MSGYVPGHTLGHTHPGMDLGRCIPPSKKGPGTRKDKKGHGIHDTNPPTHPLNRMTGACETLSSRGRAVNIQNSQPFTWVRIPCVFIFKRRCMFVVTSIHTFSGHYQEVSTGDVCRTFMLTFPNDPWPRTLRSSKCEGSTFCFDRVMSVTSISDSIRSLSFCGNIQKKTSISQEIYILCNILLLSDVNTHIHVCSSICINT